MTTITGRQSVLGVCVIAAVLVVAIGTGAAGRASAKASGDGSTPIGVGDQARDFTLRGLEGAPMTLSAFFSHRPGPH